MSESGDRRIKQSLYINRTSIKFCNDAMLARLEKFELRKDFLHVQRQETH